MSDAWLVILPAAILVTATALCVAFWGQAARQRLIAISALFLQTLVSAALLDATIDHGPVAMAMGNWPAPFGIAFVADTLGAGLSMLTGLVGLLVVVYFLGDAEERHVRGGFYPLIVALILGCNGAFLTGDIFNLYVWFEVILIASFGLLVLGGGRAQLDAAVKYAFLNLIATTFLLIAIGLLYGVVGTLNFADLAGKMGNAHLDATGLAIALLFILAFAMKSAVFPLFFWLPAAYHTPMATVSAVFAGLLTKVGIYSLYRVFSVVYPTDDPVLSGVMAWAAIGTMIFGALGALAETDVRRFVSYLVISGVGAMLAAVSIGGEAAFTGGVFYTVHSIIASAALFMAAGLMARLTGATHISQVAGIYRSNPLIAVLFFACGLSIAGVPPFAGFWAKVYLVKAALADGSGLLAAAILLSGFLTLVAVGRVWSLGFLRDRETGANAALPDERRWALVIPLAVLAGLTFGLGLAAGPVTDFAVASAKGLVDPAIYIDSVLGAGGGHK